MKKEHKSTEDSHWSELSSHKRLLVMAAYGRLSVINHAGITKPRPFQVHNGLMYDQPSFPSPRFPLSPPVKTACVISSIADNAGGINATLFVQPLQTKFTRKAPVCHRHYLTETEPLESISASYGASIPCSRTASYSSQTQVQLFEDVHFPD